MFNPVSDDFFNEESTVSDYQPVNNVIEIHPTIIRKSPDVSSDKLASPDITVADFCLQHSITSDQFLALRRKASRKNPGIDFKPLREGSRTFWVSNAAILTQMIEQTTKEPKKEPEIETVEGELVDEVIGRPRKWPRG